MNTKRIIRRMEETQQYFREIEDRKVIGALNNLCDILKDIISAVDEMEERHQNNEQGE